MQNILLSLIAGLLLVRCAETERPQEVETLKELLVTMLINYSIPLIFAIVCGALIFGIASSINTIIG